MSPKIKKIIAYSGIFLAIIATIVITILLILFSNNLKDPIFFQQFKEFLASFREYGFFIVILLQILNIIIAVIPGEPIELLAGVLYGGIGGLILCQIGVFIGSWIVFYLVRKFGTPIIQLFTKKTDSKKFDFLKNSDKLEMITFLLFFIPATPKDVLTYVIGLTDIKLSRFLVITVFARIPSIITSTLLGANLIDGNFMLSAVIFCFTGVLVIIGLFCYRLILKKHNK